jgi:hypothetical protein
MTKDGYSIDGDVGAYQQIADKQNRIAQIAMDYEYLFMFEDDNVLSSPHHIQSMVQYLEEHSDIDVLYSPYVFRNENNLPSYSVALDENTGIYFSGLSFPEHYQKCIEEKVVVPCDGIGMGATLIRVETVLYDAGIVFRNATQWEKDNFNYVGHSDTYFAVDCIKEDLKQYTDFRNIAGHITFDEKATYIMWVSPEQENNFIRKQYIRVT